MEFKMGFASVRTGPAKLAQDSTVRSASFGFLQPLCQLMSA
jgi:hypothetical protein